MANCGCPETGGVVPSRTVQAGCNRSPCGCSPTNTAACESLPSQIQNFTDQFFGAVVKTEVNGEVIWSLPCNLDTGLPNNPRGDSEGLACYFLRLFLDGIVGLTGPQGDPGTPGTNGNNAYTVTLGSFVQPTPGAPNVQVLTAYNPVFRVGEYVFIDTSGWYVITAAAASGALFLTLAKELSGASGTITAGKLVVPAGYPGAQGTPGASVQGPQGDPGPAGNTFTTTNGQYYALVGTDYQLQIAYANVTFINSAPSLLLPVAGTYQVTVVADIVGTTGVALTDNVFLKLRNSSNASDVAGSEHKLSNLVDTQREQITIISQVVTDGANQTVVLQGKATTANMISVVALNTTLTYVRLS